MFFTKTYLVFYEVQYNINQAPNGTEDREIAKYTISSELIVAAHLPHAKNFARYFISTVPFNVHDTFNHHPHFPDEKKSGSVRSLTLPRACYVRQALPALMHSSSHQSYEGDKIISSILQTKKLRSDWRKSRAGS